MLISTGRESCQDVPLESRLFLRGSLSRVRASLFVITLGLCDPRAFVRRRLHLGKAPY